MFDKKTKKIALFFGDIILLYTSLFITLMVRYGNKLSAGLLMPNLIPFLVIILFWILFFYISDLYDIEKFISPLSIGQQSVKTTLSAGALTVLFFYFFPVFQITPKRVLIIYTIISTFFIWALRIFSFKKITTSAKIKLFFAENNSNEAKELINLISQNPRLGYEIADDYKKANIIITTDETKKEKKNTEFLYELVLSGKTIMNFDKLYELLTGRIPVSLVNENWFLENLAELDKQTFEKIKRWVDILMTIIFSVPTIILFPFVAIAIKLNSNGPIFIKQKRTGKMGKVFKLYKFRSMVALNPDGLAETDIKMGWKKPEGTDARITFIGNILRTTRIDELPQIWNVLRGDLSFVGPRPERPEFVQELEKEIPYYSIRHIIKPGLTGWAQINFSGASAKDAPIKMQYDLYYIKNRSLLLEISILLKTVMVVLRRAGK